MRNRWVCTSTPGSQSRQVKPKKQTKEDNELKAHSPHERGWRCATRRVTNVQHKGRKSTGEQLVYDLPPRTPRERLDLPRGVYENVVEIVLFLFQQAHDLCEGGEVVWCGVV
jgi:hypothetical protein